MTVPDRRNAMLTKHRCSICGSRLREGQYVYSRFTKNRYCTDDRRHREIAAKRKRAQKREAA
jgi:hypothetical protein